MISPFRYEYRPRPNGRGWGAYVVGERPLAPGDEEALEQLFAERLRFANMPSEVPWMAALPLSNARIALLWRAAAAASVFGLAINESEWPEYKNNLFRLFESMDAGTAAGTPELLEALASLQSGAPVESLEVPFIIGPTCVDYLQYAEVFRARRTAHLVEPLWYVSAWRRGAPLPIENVFCPFEVAEGGAVSVSSIIRFRLHGEPHKAEVSRQPAIDKPSPESSGDAGNILSSAMLLHEWREHRAAIERQGNRYARYAQVMMVCLLTLSASIVWLLLWKVRSGTITEGRLDATVMHSIAEAEKHMDDRTSAINRHLDRIDTSLAELRTVVQGQRVTKDSSHVKANNKARANHKAGGSSRDDLSRPRTIQ